LSPRWLPKRRHPTCLAPEAPRGLRRAAGGVKVFLTPSCPEHVMPPRNVIVIMTDELRRDALGCYGSTIARTPHIDALAARGLRFDAAYTPCPICVPARGAIATGRYVHEIGCWSNAQPYAGVPDSWHHRLRADGCRVVSIGKLHFRGGDDNGFTEEIRPLHVKDGRGWVHGLLRDREDLFDASEFARAIGPGEDGYSDFDREACAGALDWIRDRAHAPSDRPWALYLSFLRPHYPLTCPPEYYALHEPEHMPLPLAATPGMGTDHPILAGMRRACDYDAPFTDEKRRIAVASYHGLVSFVDDMVGRVLATLAATGQAETTCILFTSDHGECLGDRGFWTKMVMYEESAAVPLILAGPDIAPGVVPDPVSLIDIYPTVLDLAGVDRPANAPPHGRSLLETARSPDPERPILSEYHDYGAATAMMMLRQGRWKLVAYPGFDDQLFDLTEDPGETRDLGRDPAHAAIRSHLNACLRGIADPAETNARAFADQAARIAELGGREAIMGMRKFDHTPVG
jgi:choline-sulfatase